MNRLERCCLIITMSMPSMLGEQMLFVFDANLSQYICINLLIFGNSLKGEHVLNDCKTCWVCYSSISRSSKDKNLTVLVKNSFFTRHSVIFSASNISL